MAVFDPQVLPRLSTHWQNASLSSIHSAITYYTAIPYGSPVEMETPWTSEVVASTRQALTSDISHVKSIDSKTSYKKRHDSGYSEGDLLFSTTPSTSPRRRSTPSAPNSRRQSSEKSSSSSSSSSPRNSDSTSTSSGRAISPTKRARSKRPHRSTPAVPQRLPLRSHHTSPYPLQDRSQSHHQPHHQFFHFTHSISPSISHVQTPHTIIHPDPEPRPSTPPPPPPPTTHYWTSNRTRRLEYAAIDAASRGFRGFVSKLVPDCFLGAESSYRRRGFWCERAKKREGSEDDDGGSVRRYRLDLDVEEGEDDEVGDEKTIQLKEGSGKGWAWKMWGR